MTEQARLYQLAAGAWRAFENAAALSSRVSPAIPILFFGNLNSYLSSRVRILTVELNPSLIEFPKKRAYQRFPLAKGDLGSEPDRYLQALSDYFRTCPYWKWFRGFELMLNGMGASYCKGQPSTALHTDICSPIATNPTWSCLGPEQQIALKKDGGPLWHRLLEVLRPEIVVFWVGFKHLPSFTFEAVDKCYPVHVYTKNKNGSERERPVEVCAQWFEIRGDRSLFIFINPAQQAPLSFLDDSKKRKTGVIAFEELRRGPIALDRL